MSLMGVESCRPRIIFIAHDPWNARFSGGQCLETEERVSDGYRGINI